MPKPIEKENLPSGYAIRLLPEAEFMPLFRVHRPNLFSQNIDFNLQEALSAEELAVGKNLRKNMDALRTICLGIYHQDSFVGWSFGRQIDDEIFYMINSAIFPDHRRKGLYSAVVKRMVDEASGFGFQIITSRHAVSNNAVLIPKLKFGFIITGFDIADQFGILVKLSFFLNPLRKKIMQFRIGELKPDAEMKRLLGL